MEQAEQLGTGHAVEQAMPGVEDSATVLVLYGDVPLVRRETAARMATIGADGVALLTVCMSDPTGYGRIVRDDTGKVSRIVEEKDADENERAIAEVNTGLLAAPAAFGRPRRVLVPAARRRRDRCAKHPARSPRSPGYWPSRMTLPVP